MADNHTRIAAVAQHGRGPSDSNPVFKFASLDRSNGNRAPHLNLRHRAVETVELRGSRVRRDVEEVVLMTALCLVILAARSKQRAVLALGRRTGMF